MSTGHHLRPKSLSDPLCVADVINVVDALLPAGATAELVLPLLSQTRANGRVIVLHTTPEAQARLGKHLALGADDLDEALRCAPADNRRRILDGFVEPDHHGCSHLRAQLERTPSAAALLRAFLMGRWYGWPGLIIDSLDDGWGKCCCGLAHDDDPLRRRPPTPRRSMTAIDI